MTNTNNTATLWTVELIEARRATGDALVTVGDWSCSMTTGGQRTVGAARLSLRRTEPRTYKTLERDARDGEIFETAAHADCYALNAGRLRWFSEYKAEQAAALAV